MTYLLDTTNDFDLACDGQDDGAPMSIGSTLDMLEAAVRHLTRLQGHEATADTVAAAHQNNVIPFPLARL